jgi:predicted metalloprotease with PDZ domain
MQKLSITILCLLMSVALLAQKMAYTVSMERPAEHYFQVKLVCEDVRTKTADLKMPVWSPGYYQRLDYANNLERFHVVNEKGDTLKWRKTAGNSWQVQCDNNKKFIVTYVIKATRSFVATSFLDATHGYIVPAGVFLHIDRKISLPVEVTIQPYGAWTRIATGLDTVAGKPFTYYASDFDVLYDSPFLVGNLDELPAFTVQGIPHRFIGYNIDSFDRVRFMHDLKKVVEASVAIIGHIPYKEYTFIGIGPGQGGIEHANSTTISFTKPDLDNRNRYLQTLNFIAHEYFHHYNVKRIRPVELGPFDYDHGSRTNMLWVSEGLTVYYEYLVVKRANLSTAEELFDALRHNILAYETKEGRHHQSLVQASLATWADGPFGRSGDGANKTISYYDKGPVVGLLLDLAIRHHTKNRRSLDDVMRILYRTYYQQKKRGFTEAEFRAVCEQTAGTSLAGIFEYVTTTKELDYKKYLSYAGLDIDVTNRSFHISRMRHPDPLQADILKSWLGK